MSMLFINQKDIEDLKEQIEEEFGLKPPKKDKKETVEDRIIKNEFNRLTSTTIPVEVPIIDEKINYCLINKHPIIPSEQELAINNRARSAKLRGIMCVDTTRGETHV